jgi:hypothetical protein
MLVSTPSSLVFSYCCRFWWSQVSAIVLIWSTIMALKVELLIELMSNMSIRPVIGWKQLLSVLERP